MKRIRFTLVISVDARLVRHVERLLATLGGGADYVLTAQEFDDEQPRRPLRFFTRRAAT